MREIMSNFEEDFIRGTKDYDEGKELTVFVEFGESDAYIRGFKARQLEDELNKGKRND